MKAKTPGNGRPIFHLLPNAHLDPVWLWDWREGLNEGLTTVRAVLNLMDEFPQLTFIRGESSIYEHIEKTDPKTFERIVRMVKSGRWDIVGGTYVQPDSNLASAESLCRQFEVGMNYFSRSFGITPRVSWQADCFGHTPEWPSIVSSFGINGFAFTRPQKNEFPMNSPAFWWKSQGPQKILCYRQHWPWYCSERFNLKAVLDETLAGYAKSPFVNSGVFMGLGNHGGGPSRRHILEAEEWAAAHPEVEVRFSTLHGFFDALRSEVAGKSEIPVHQGDMGFCLRGCYSSAMKFKSAHRRAEAFLSSAEVTQSIIGVGLKQEKGVSLDQAWKGTLFNSFHDILPGSSIERALEDQLALSGLVLHQSQQACFEALNHLALQVNTSVPSPSHPDLPTAVPLLVWNPLPRPYKGWVELEASLDYRPIVGHTAAIGSLQLGLSGPDGEEPAFQEISTEHHSMRDLAWRKRVTFQTEIPPLGWKVFRLGYKPSETQIAGEDLCAADAVKPPKSEIENGDWRIAVTPEKQVKILCRNKSLLGGDGLMRVITVDDIYGSWGGMNEEPDSFNADTVRFEWSVEDNVILENGPERTVIWTHWVGGNSWMDLTFYLNRESNQVRVKARLLLNERSARVKLVLPASGPLVMQVPAGIAKRPQSGHLPSGRWVRKGEGADAVGFVSDVLSDVDASENILRVTLARASRYADDVPTAVNVTRWLPAMDCGEMKFEFLLTPGESDLECLAQDLLSSPVVLPTSAHEGVLPDVGSFGRIEPDDLSLLAVQRGDDGGLAVRIQNRSKAEVDAFIHFCGEKHSLGSLNSWEIRTEKVNGPKSKKIPSMQLRAVIFDLDGVLVSTDDLHYQGWKRLADEEGIYFDETINHGLRGVSRMESLEILLKRSKRTYTREEKVAMGERKNRYYRDLLQGISPSAVLPGALELCRELRERGIKLAIGSSSCNSPLILEKTGMAQWFHATADGNDIKRSKPDPEVFLLAASRLGVDPKNGLVVEDAPSGVEGAVNGGFRCLAVGAAQDDPKADWSAPSLAGVTAENLIALISAGV